MPTEVRNNTTLERFEVYVDGTLAGYADYQETAAERAFVHTAIYPRHQGEGYGRILIEAALNSTRQEGFGVLPMCPMVHHFIEANPAYVAMVPQWARHRLGMPQ